MEIPTMRDVRRWTLAVVALAVAAGAGPAAAAAPNYPRLLEQAALEFERLDSGAFRVLYEFDDGRSQLVFLQPQGTFEDVSVVEVYSPVMRIADGNLPAALARRLLEASGQRKLTYFGVEEVEGTLMVFCYHNLPADRLDADTLATTLLAVATFGDEMEKEQLGAMSDEF
ncbi:MAG TPA: hypothetical protein VHM02_04225 [Thermoanaerobaculia bacterium]|nr:hypothetical protein [Thermoanaerobaculia bacterium]